LDDRKRVVSAAHETFVGGRLFVLIPRTKPIAEAVHTEIAEFEDSGGSNGQRAMFPSFS
jgi:hypothetical protein